MEIDRMNHCVMGRNWNWKKLAGIFTVKYSKENNRHREF